MSDKKNSANNSLNIAQKVGDKAIDIQSSSSSHFNKYLTKRVGRIVGVRRFIASWLLLAVIVFVTSLLTLRQLYSAGHTTASANGGTYTEGVVGTVHNLNPLFATGAVDETAVRLSFNGLLRYNTDNKLVGDLATDWSNDDTHKIYTVNLRHDIKWQDGQPFTADDVVYTIQAIQNPETRSTMFASWQDIKVTASGAYSVRFELPAPFAPFENALTVPILPKHLLTSVAVKDLRTATYNSAPIGTGPFVFQSLHSTVPHEQQLEFSSNKNYYRGVPKLDHFVVHSYEDEQPLVQALAQRNITAAVDLKADNSKKFTNDTSIRLGNIPLNSGVFAFFKTTTPPLDNAQLRTALTQAIDRQALLKLFDARYLPLKTPLLPSQLGYDGNLSQHTDVAASAAALDQLGWKLQPNGQRAKDGRPLQFNLLTVNTPEYTALAGILQKQWAAVGVTVKAQLLTPDQLQQSALSAHAYDILLYGISLGSDPDVYAYWDSTQARQDGLNFSEWQSSRADSSLETARTRLEPVLRIARYQTFQDEWLKSSPAVALYQPRVSYAYHQNVTGFVGVNANSAADRLTNVEDWTVNTRTVDKTP